jgi:hypothetical protein
MESTKSWWGYSVWLTLLAVLTSVALTLQTGFALSKFGGIELVPRITTLSIIRVQAQGVVFSAALFAWISATHDSPKPFIRSKFWATARRLVLTWPLAYAFATLLGILASAAALRLLFGLPWRTSFQEVSASLLIGDAIFGFAVTIPHAALLIAVSWFVTPRLAGLPWGLARKLVTVWGALAFIRIVAEIAVAVAA